MIAPDCPLVLGSASPRRSDILSSLGIPFVVLPGNIEEATRPGEAPLAYVERIALGKLEAVWGRLAQGGPPAVASRGVAGVLVADTIVVIDGEILGKPADTGEAVHMLERLAGRTHTVFTRYCIGAAEPRTADQQVRAARTVRTEVRIRAATPAEIRGYAATGEGLDKAGAYAAQGIGAFLVEAIDGSYTNVVGLPACEVVSDLGRLGLLGDFPRPPRAAS